MTCACTENADHTQILTPCQLHATWAKTYAAQTWGDRGPPTPYTAPRPDRRSTDATAR
jgi:hypothetical protein